MRLKLLPQSFTTTSLAGYLVAAVSGVLILVLFLVGRTVGENPYLGLVTYLILPLLLLLGVALVIFGSIAARKGRRRRALRPGYPVIDLNDQRHRRSFWLFLLSAAGFLTVMALVTVKGYEYSGSPSFCGLLCHQVMEPEYVAWGSSAHARVACAECHMGSGGAAVVSSNLSALRLATAAATGSYPRPIPTPLKDLRPSRQTCERCHWRDKMFLVKYREYRHFAMDAANSPRHTTLLLKVGGMESSAGEIHRHIGMRVAYIPRDARHQDIPYVTLTTRNETVEYYDVANPPDADLVKGGKRIAMDCLDCHNRATHVYRPPGPEVDRYLATGRIDRTIPYIRKVGVELLSRPYRSTEEGMAAIAVGVEVYYKQLPEIAARKQGELRGAVRGLQEIYRRNYFPAMRVDWSTYADNNGHLNSPGCFRCHDGRHRSRDGRVISKDCGLCHLVLSQTQENVPAGTYFGEYVHPVEIGADLLVRNCSECHGKGW